MENIDIIQQVAHLVSNHCIDEAKEVLNKDYQHKYIKYEKRKLSATEKLRIFKKDGFIDRYTGKKLLFPSVLRILSIILEDSFPYHKNWKMSDCHIAYWELTPTCDHIIPIARGGEDVDTNIVTTSQIMNSAKSNFLIEELGLTLHPRGNNLEWDGMMDWYKHYIRDNPSILNDSYLRHWHLAFKKIEHVDSMDKH